MSYLKGLGIFTLLYFIVYEIYYLLVIIPKVEKLPEVWKLVISTFGILLGGLWVFLLIKLI